MGSSLKHNVSRVSWNLEFDQRDKITELQSVFGHWSKERMAQEMEEVFNNYCPEDQVWQIKTLELDLGLLDYETIESDLPKQFKKILSGKLSEIALENGNSDIVIVDPGTAKINEIEHYLQTGYFSTSYKYYSSINVLFLEQLQENPEAFTKMILEAGQLEKVRQRIVEQLKVSVIQELVRLLEPDNYTQLIDFTEEMSVVNDQRTRKTNQSDFRKNLWLWVLNYLFVERGTLFNQLEFMESTIRQMANHYNMKYEDLFNEIEQTAKSIAETSSKNSEFIAALNLLSKQHSVKIKQQRGANDKLEKILSNSRLLSQTEHQHFLNSIIKRISEASEMLMILKRLKSSLKSWDNVLTCLDVESKKVITSVLGFRYKYFIKETVKIFEFIGGHSNQKNDYLQTKIIEFLLEKSTGSWQKKDLIDYLIPYFKTKNQITNLSTCLVRLMTTDSDYLKSEISSDTYQITKKCLEDYLSVSPQKLNKIVFETGLKYLFDQSKKQVYYNNADLISKLQILLNKPEVGEVGFLKQKLSECINSKNFEVVAHELISADLADKLISGINKKIGDTVNRIKTILQKSEHKTGRNIAQNFSVETLILLLQNPGISPEAFYDIMLKNKFDDQFYQVLSIYYNSEFIQINQPLIPGTKVEKLDKLRACEQVNDLVKWIRKNGADASLKPHLVNQFILVNGAKKEVNFEKLNTRDQRLISEFLIPGSWQLLQLYQDKKIRLDVSGFTFLQSVFWKILLDVKAHSFKLSTFKTRLKKTVEVLMLHSENRKRGSKKPVSGGSHMDSSELINPEMNTPEYQQEFMRKFEAALLSNVLIVIEASDAISKSAEKLEILSKQISFRLFTERVFYRTDNTNYEIKSVLEFLYELVRHASASLKHELKNKLWRTGLKLSKKRGDYESILNGLFKEVFKKLFSEGVINQSIIQRLVETRPDLSVIIKENLSGLSAGLAGILSGKRIGISINENIDSIPESSLRELLITLIKDGRLPYWFKNTEQKSNKEILNNLMLKHPYGFGNLLKTKSFNDTVLLSLFKRVNIEAWFSAVTRINPHQTDLLNQFQKLYRLIAGANFKTVNTTSLTQALYIKMMMAWKAENWDSFSSQKIWETIVWEVVSKQNVKKELVLKDFKAIRYQLPTALQFSLKSMIKRYQEDKEPLSALDSTVIIKPKFKSPKTGKSPEGIAINNAGIVLISGYLKTLFDRLELLEGDLFSDDHSRERAVHFVQFVANGITHNEEQFLVLNKLLCGLSIDTPISAGIEVTDDERTLIEGMINAIIKHWPSIGECSVDGFRGNWLIRDGVLFEEEDRWNLVIEKRAYDILIHKSPFSFSILKFPWMEKPIHVNWPY